MSAPAWSYDLIAEVYATDMGRSMPFDDAGFYRRLCLAHGGRVLELGCGTGRILLELLGAGVDAVGVDRSLPMLARLQRDAAARGLRAPVAQMDLRALGLASGFDVILAPYSLVTYLVEPAEFDAFLATARDLLAPGGVLVLDAFVPRDVAAFDDFRLDYRRPHGAGFLERHKRIACLPGGSHRIERRYRLLDAAQRQLEEFTTTDWIRPMQAGYLREHAAAQGLRLREEWHDYGSEVGAGAPRFYSAGFVRAP